jgi:hypothetical protein
MQLLALTPEEIAYLGAPVAEPDGLDARLTRKLAQTLTARLHLPVQVYVRAADGIDPAPGLPSWQPDTALATLWLTRRLGGQRVTGAAATFVPKGLLLSLDAALAECWLDAPASSMPSALAWRIITVLGQACLAVRLPLQTSDMTRWAREVIQHGH